MSKPIYSGMVVRGERSIPLTGVRIDATLHGLCARVTITQRYRNDESVPVECVYVFPLEEGAAVSGFEARIGERVIEGRVEERDKAFETYDDAMADGHGAFLLDQERPNIFTASIGNLDAGQSVEVAITYVALLSHEGDAVRFSLPTTISPRYVPSAETNEVGEPDGERVNPERWTQVPYGLTLVVDLDMDAAIRVVESPSHAIRTELDGHTARVTLSSRDTALDRDFVLLAETRSAHEPSARVAQEADGTRVAMVTFTPATEDMPTSHGHEIDFVLDCSGSMRGESIDEARRALALCVRAMSEGDTFNIIRFGSRYQSLWKTPQPYNQDNLDQASAYIQQSKATLGGTEILSPLQQIVSVPPDPERPRQILLLTDGQVSNESAVIDLCRQHASNTRVFAFGIGAGASEHLVRGVARASRGAAEFIFLGERIEPKVLRMFGRVATPALTDVRVDWGGLRVNQAPSAPPAVFGGDSLTVFARVVDGVSNRVTLTSKERRWEVRLDLERADKDSPIPTLYARHAIRDLEEGHGARRGSAQSRKGKADKTRDRIVELGCRYGLMSSATSYVAVDTRSGDKRTTRQAQLRRIPIALTTGWGSDGNSVRSRKRTGRPSARGGMAPPRAQSASYTMAAMAPPAPMGRPRPAPSTGAAPPDQFQDSSRRFAKPPAPMAPPVSMAPPAPMAPRSVDAEWRADSAQSADRVFELLLTQRADGSFALSSILRIWLGGAIAAVTTAMSEHGDALVITSVVIALFERDAADRIAEWTPAVRKARRWLGRQNTQVDGTALIGDGS